ncbi:hypothetical protein SPOA0328 (plasmid) [Ruegeria pomeroyi DSS-3]|uniref:Immunity MXAN-0049 protein domain-containing protein n=2 Tax=Ruegeria pomeroyi TaxID=89184 RepID=Q5LKQ3_RUEPO|nr:DUF1629 domain-containing protein [Ruegeria pomeroyi]AAV97460.1 hypothetical protein SPOA0328 [Ruegeria pomeroyi DSS-3]NVK97791.1 hypothetical protein [Ruegeria pomeroyi]NVL02549.1 hypothetical protein [Ruegeria pomeroyi]HCE71817.1 hypothetical protein [Ruegeria sp.]
MHYWVLGQQNTGEYSGSLNPLDGDLGHVELVDTSIDIGIKPIMQSLVMTAGRRVKPERLPRKVSHDMSADRIDDLAMVHTYLTVSEPLRTLIEQFAPGDVQYEPFDVVGKRDGAFQQRRYWFIPTVRLHAMDKDKTRPPLADIGYFRQSTPLEDQHIVFDASVTDNRAIFASAEYPGILFVSDALVEAIEASGLTGARFRRRFASTASELL